MTRICILNIGHGLEHLYAEVPDDFNSFGKCNAKERRTAAERVDSMTMKFNEWYEKRYREWRERQQQVNQDNRRRIDDLLVQVAELKAQLERLRGEII